MPDSLTIKLSYTVCSCTPWPVSLRDTARFTMREPKTPEELRAEREAIKRAGGTGKPKPYKFTSHSCVETRNGSGYFLIGFWPHLKLELEKRNIPYSIDDQRDQTLRPDPDYSCLSGIQFRQGQAEALASIISSDGGLLCSNVSFGKSFLIKVLCQLYPTLNILVVCNAGEVVRELYRAISDVLPGQVGLLDMKHSEINGKRIIVTTTKSMTKVKPEQVQLMLVDECHCAGYNETGFQLQQFCFCRRFGFTATPIRNQGDHLYFESLFGPVLQQQTFEQSVAAGSVTPIEYTMVPIEKKLTYLDDIKQLPNAIQYRLMYTNNPVRNRLIAGVFNDIRQANPDAQILIMTQTIEHLIRLCELIPGLHFAHGERGDLSSYKRKKGLENVDMFKYRQSAEQLSYVKKQAELGEYKSLIATGVWSKGINLHHLSVLIRADGAVSGIPSVQIPGRLARLDDGKEVAFLVDFSDEFCESAGNRAIARTRHYNKEGYACVSYIDMLQEIRRTK